MRGFALGLWHYRTARHEQAVHLLTLGMHSSEDDKVVHACFLAVRSMSLRKLGQAEEADADFAEAQLLVEAMFAGPMEFESQGYWHDWLNARILLRETAPPGGYTLLQFRPSQTSH